MLRRRRHVGRLVVRRLPPWRLIGMLGGMGIIRIVVSGVLHGMMHRRLRRGRCMVVVVVILLPPGRVRMHGHGRRERRRWWCCGTHLRVHRAGALSPAAQTGVRRKAGQPATQPLKRWGGRWPPLFRLFSPTLTLDGRLSSGRTRPGRRLPTGPKILAFSREGVSSPVSGRREEEDEEEGEGNEERTNLSTRTDKS